MRSKKLFVLLLTIPFIFSLGCAELGIQNKQEPLAGDDVTLYNMADGQLEFRIKVTGMTSTLWITADLVNNSESNLSFDAKSLLQFSDPTCLADNDFEKVTTTVVPSKSFQRLHYSFQLYSKKKNSPEYARCKDVPLRFRVEGLNLANSMVKPITFSID